MAIFTVRAFVSSASRGRPGPGVEIDRQYLRKPWWSMRILAAMPANNRLWSNDDKVVSPLRPQPGKGDPERSIERAQPRSRPFLGLNCELLPEGQLDDGLFLTTSEEGAQAVEKSD